MTERYAKLGRQHIASTGSHARGIWKLMEVKIAGQASTVSSERHLRMFGYGSID
jgi:hypothetical protein